jgi:ABC-type polysaccharide transport system permease subunit
MTHSVKGACFQPLSLSSETPVSSLCFFFFQLVPLQDGSISFKDVGLVRCSGYIRWVGLALFHRVMLQSCLGVFSVQTAAIAPT